MTSVQRRLVWAAQPVLITLVLWLAIGGPRRDVRDPLVFSGDGVVTLAQTKLILDQGSWWTLPDLGIPGQETLLSRQNAHIDVILVRAASVFSRRPEAVVTLAWVFMLVLAGASSAWCLRRVGVSMAAAWSAGALFALCPFALGHNTANFGVMPYLVPFAATAALQLAMARPADTGWRGWGGLAAGGALLGLNAFATALFGAFFVGVGAVAGLVRSRRQAPVTAGAVVLTAIVLATVLNVTWTRHRGSDPTPDAASADVRGLKIRELITPLRDHWFEPFRAWAAREEHARFPGGMTHVRLGLVATVGFLGLLVVLFVPSVAGPTDGGDAMRAASRLTLAAIMLATVGGLGSVAGVLVSPAVGDYAGVTPFLAFLALAAVALAVDRATDARRQWRAVVWAGLLVIGLLDQSVGARPIRASRAEISQEFKAVRAFVSALEGALPQGARVLQLPVRPENALRGAMRMGPSDNFKPWLVSRALRWSAADVSTEDTRQTETTTLDPRDQPSYFRRQGFSAIVVDRFGFRDGGATLLNALKAVPQDVRLIVQDGRYVALDIREP